MRLKLALSYDGSAYSGWQLQAGNSSSRTIQGTVEAALFTLLRRPIRVNGAGRTDAGVHALGQIAHCDVPERDWNWRERLNSLLPPDIRILYAARVADSFHSRKDALAKTYIYRLWLEPDFIQPEIRNFVWPCGRLDVDLVNAGLKNFLGRHDFASFQNSGTDVKSTVRTILAIGLEKSPANIWLPPHAPLQTLVITGDGFLKQMVRNIVGFIVAVGKGKIGWGSLPEIIARKQRQALPTATAPAKGLFLASIDYDKRDTSI